jgi:DNA-binding LytR/AlgR family response regulator
VPSVSTLHARSTTAPVLGGMDFIRVSRSLIIRAADIVSFERNFRGRLNVHLRSGKSITCTTGYREQLLRYFGVLNDPIL